MGSNYYRNHCRRIAEIGKGEVAISLNALVRVVPGDLAAPLIAVAAVKPSLEEGNVDTIAFLNR